MSCFFKDNSFCVVTVFGPALQNIDYVIEYVKNVKNNKAHKTELFTDMYEIIANPALFSDHEIWIIILDILSEILITFLQILCGKFFGITTKR